MARHYAGDNTVAFFELFNEPALGDKLGDCSWQQWKQIMEEIIAAIRTNGGTAVPLVAGFDFGYDLTPVAKAPINAEGIGYVSHPYAMKRKAPWPEQWTRDWGFVADTYPVFVTEIGFCPADDKQAHIPVIGDETYGDVLTSYFEKKGHLLRRLVLRPGLAPIADPGLDLHPDTARGLLQESLSEDTQTFSGRPGELKRANEIPPSAHQRHLRHPHRRRSRRTAILQSVCGPLTAGDLPASPPGHCHIFLRLAHILYARPR